MMAKPYTIRVSSQKSGVGKTTIAVNLASSLADMGYNVLAVDTDFSNPSIGFHLGLEDSNLGTAAVINGRTTLEKAMVRHDTTGMQVLPCEVNNILGSPPPKQMRTLAYQLSKTSFDFIVVDTPPGFTDNVEYFYDEALIVTTPDLPALASVLRLADIYDKAHIKHSLIVNRVKRRGYEVNIREMEKSYGKSAEQIFPESDIVPRSISAHIPAVLMNSKDPFSKAASELSDTYTYRIEGKSKGRKIAEERRSIIARFIDWLAMRFG